MRSELQLQDYLRIFRKRIWWILGCTVFVPLAMKMTMKEPVPYYRATAVVELPRRKPLFMISGGKMMWWSQTEDISTQMEIIKSQKVILEAVRKMGLISKNEENENLVRSLRRKINTRRIEKTRLIQIQVTDRNPQFAKDFANALAESYIEHYSSYMRAKTEEQRKFIEEHLKVVRRKIKEIEDEIKRFKSSKEYLKLNEAKILENKLGELSLKLSSLLEKYTEDNPEVQKLKEEIKRVQRLLGEAAGKETEMENLYYQLELNKKILNSLTTKLLEVSLNRIEEEENPVLVSKASLPVVPINPRKKLNLVIGIVSGIIFGLLFAVLAEMLDTSLSSPEEIEEKFKISVLGIIPVIKEQEKLLLFSSKFRFRDDYMSLLTNIILKAGHDANMVVVTSALPNEGKTLTACNLATISALNGKKTLLIDCDLRKPDIFRILNLPLTPGLKEIIDNEAKKEKAIHDITSILIANSEKRIEIMNKKSLTKLNVLTSGKISNDYERIFVNPSFTRLLRYLKEHYEFCVIDAPPLLTAPETLSLISQVKSVIIVSQKHKNSRELIKRITQIIKDININFCGIVLNNVREKEIEGQPGYYRYYRYYKYYKKYYKNK